METYHGLVRTPADAIKLFEACRLGLLPRVQRRLSEKERQSIRSGSVFVWDEREAGMRRWTDGKSWSASRVSGSFLTYREMEGKRGSGFGGSARRGATKTPDSGRGSDEDQDHGEPEGYRYKADGLMKQSFSITTSAGQHLHLIAYYSRPQPGSPELLQPSTDPALRHITPVKGMYPESSLHDSNPTPALTRAPMVQQTPYMMPQHTQQAPPPPPPPPPGTQQYPPQYAQPPTSYHYPPSPVATPPYSHYAHQAYASSGPQGQQQQQQPPHLPPPHPYQTHAMHQPPPPPHHQPHPSSQPSYASAPVAYERSPLPPPPPQEKPVTYQHYPSHNHHSPRSNSSPRSQHLQAQAAQAVLMDSSAGSSRLSQGQLPPVREHAPHPSYTPPNRNLSVSPPRSSHSESANAATNENKASISALLSSDPSANNGTTSANSSPRTANSRSGLPAPERSVGLSHDAKAIQMLDRKFRI